MVQYGIKYHSTTNNEAKYEVIAEVLELARGLGAKWIELKSDSHLVVN